MSDQKSIDIIFACIFKKGTLHEKLKGTTVLKHKKGKWKANGNVARKLQQILIQNYIYPKKLKKQKGIVEENILTTLYNEDTRNKKFFVVLNHEHFGQVTKIEKNNGTITKLVIRVKKLTKSANKYFKFWKTMRKILQKKMQQVEEQKEKNWQVEKFKLQSVIRKPPEDPIEWVVEKTIPLEGKKLSMLTRLFIEDKENPLNPYTSGTKIVPSYEKQFVQDLNEDLVRYGYVALKTDASNELDVVFDSRIYEIYPVKDIDLTQVQRRAIGKWEKFKAVSEIEMNARFETFKEEERNKTDEAWKNSLKVASNREKEEELNKSRAREEKKRKRLTEEQNEAFQLDNNLMPSTSGGSSSSSSSSAQKKKQRLQNLRKKVRMNFMLARSQRNEKAKKYILLDATKDFPEDDNNLIDQTKYQDQKSRFYTFLFNYAKKGFGFFGRDFLKQDMTPREIQNLRQRQKDLEEQISNTKRFMIFKDKEEMMRQDMFKSVLSYGENKQEKIEKIPLLKVNDKVKFGRNTNTEEELLEEGRILRVPTSDSQKYVIETDHGKKEVSRNNIFYKFNFTREFKRVDIRNYTKKERARQKEQIGHYLSNKIVTNHVEHKYMDIRLDEEKLKKLDIDNDISNPDPREDYMVKVESGFVAWDDVDGFFRPYYGTVVTRDSRGNIAVDGNGFVEVRYSEGEFGIGNNSKKIRPKNIKEDDRKGRTIDRLKLRETNELLKNNAVSPLQSSEKTLLVALPGYMRHSSDDEISCYRVGQLRQAVLFETLHGRKLMPGPDVEIYPREKVINNYETFRQVCKEIYMANVDSNIDEYTNLFQLYTKLNTIKERVEKMLQQRLQKRPEQMEEVKKITLTNFQSVPKMVWVGDGMFTGRSNCIYHWRYTTEKFMLPEGNKDFKASFYELIETEATRNRDRDLVSAYNSIDHLFYEILTVLQSEDHQNNVNNLILKINNFVREFNRR